MGKLLNIVSYVTGLKSDGSDLQSDYVLKKREYLRLRADALAYFGNTLISENAWRSSFPAEMCTSEEVIETNLDNRPRLRELVRRKDDGEELSFVVVEARDLCRIEKNTVKVDIEQQAFEDIAYNYLSTIFAGDFTHADRWSPIERATTSQEERSVCESGAKIVKKIMEYRPNGKNASELDDLQRELLGHVGSANHVLQRMVLRIVGTRKVNRLLKR